MYAETDDLNIIAYVCEADNCRGKIISLLLGVGQLLSEQNDIVTALDRLLGYMKTEMGMERCMVSLLHRESGQVFVYRSLGITPSEQDRGTYQLGEGITGKVVETAQPIVVRRIRDEPGYLNRTGSLATERDRDNSFICVPIKLGRKVLGAIGAVRHYQTDQFMDKHVKVLGVMAHMLSHAVELYLVENIDKVEWERRTRTLLGELKERYHPSNIIGVSKPMLEVYELIRKVSATKTTVLLLGESGVGKEMVANAIHYGGLNAGGPYVKFNCAALPESIVESELFGHEKGSFTGAEFRKGRFEAAEAGTIFLDEVGELSLKVQAKLLRLLQERQFERVGGNKSINLNIRVIAATNRDLRTMVDEGTFREDLFYRLDIFPIMIPPLRERDSDIVSLAEHFLLHYAKEAEKSISNISVSAMNHLLAYCWPGNVRELENVIHRAVILADDSILHAHDLPLHIRQPETGGTTAQTSLDDRLASIEYDMLVETLRRSQGNTTEAAKSLGLTRRTIGLRMKRFGLTYRQFRTSSQKPDN
ncbi:MAG: sigma 54-interacting transcriptional regulator [Deltaproteobacteria bacterium]|jgi:Nif-specific regulatory protein|nr:sigma 54-interacting transcriptional regulator [Deltaproteobacteria bacterium]